MTPSPKPKQHAPIIWERAPLAAYPIVAYMVVESSLPKLKARKRAAVETLQSALFEVQTAAVAEQNTAETGEREIFLMRLPYTREALVRRQAFGRYVPDWAFEH